MTTHSRHSGNWKAALAHPSDSKLQGLMCEEISKEKAVEQIQREPRILSSIGRRSRDWRKEVGSAPWPMAWSLCIQAAEMA